MKGFCRACLVNYDQPKDLLQYTEKNRRLYVYSTGIQVKRNDAFPFQLCKDCYTKLKQSCNFKKLCRDSDKNIRNYQALKEAGEDVDFVTFMRKNESTLAFRFPLSGHSTPAFNRGKDDDNVSTTTSIRNFMRDILPPEDIPDSEVTIIRQVIEEEADILDESLDSQWLQDDLSLDSDFQLGCGFSPFSTPNHNAFDNIPKLNDTQSSFPDISKLLDLESPIKNEPLVEVEDNTEQLPKEPPVYYVERVIADVKNESDPLQSTLGESMRCVIDKNLDRALECDDKSEFALEDLLATPAESAVSISTRSINNMLFGNKENNGQHNQFPEKFKNIFDDNEMDVLDEFYNYSDEDNKSDILDPANVADKYDRINFTCKLCNNKKFKDLRCLNIHFVKQHKISICDKKKERKKNHVCDLCGKMFEDRRNCARHIKNVHKKPEVVMCKICSQTFKYESCLKSHMKSHNIYDDEPKKRKYVCSICGKSYTKRYSLTLHTNSVHTKTVRVTCNDCGRGFQRKIDLLVHIRTHTGEKPFLCLYCDKRYARRDALSRHIKCHLADHLSKPHTKRCKIKLKQERAKNLKDSQGKHMDNNSKSNDNKNAEDNIEDQENTIPVSPNQNFVIKPKDIASLVESEILTNTGDELKFKDIGNGEDINPQLSEMVSETNIKIEIEEVANAAMEGTLETGSKISEADKTAFALDGDNILVQDIVPWDHSLPMII